MFRERGQNVVVDRDLYSGAFPDDNSARSTMRYELLPVSIFDIHAECGAPFSNLQIPQRDNRILSNSPPANVIVSSIIQPFELFCSREEDEPKAEYKRCGGNGPPAKQAIASRQRTEVRQGVAVNTRPVDSSSVGAHSRVQGEGLVNGGHEGRYPEGRHTHYKHEMTEEEANGECRIEVGNIKLKPASFRTDDDVP